MTVRVSYDHVDIQACQEKGIRVGHTPGVLTDTSADLTLALLLAVARRIPEAAESVRRSETNCPLFVIALLFLFSLGGCSVDVLVAIGEHGVHYGCAARKCITPQWALLVSGES